MINYNEKLDELHTLIDKADDYGDTIIEALRNDKKISPSGLIVRIQYIAKIRDMLWETLTFLEDENNIPDAGIIPPDKVWDGDWEDL